MNIDFYCSNDNFVRWTCYLMFGISFVTLVFLSALGKHNIQTKIIAMRISFIIQMLLTIVKRANL